ncbi:MAG TPA: hypothetical protein VGD65_19015 [Chryseosolibacter sp.]
MAFKNSISRTEFIASSLAIAGVSFFPTSSILGQEKKQEKPAPLNLEIVKEFVGASHGKFDRVKEMLEENHLLLHASYDWGGGDFESGIEAAGHVGNKEIATYLLSKGARYNVYLACMLGHLEVVKQVLTFNAGLLNSKGPHGFTMLHHANKGGDEALPVAEYLKSLGAKETRMDFYVRA